MPSVPLVIAALTRRFMILYAATCASTRASACCTHGCSMTRPPSSSVVCAHFSVFSNNGSSAPMLPSAARSKFSCVVISRQPSFSPPTIELAGTRTSS
jgi:hypothetical protein